jgi:hypothetical protein
MAAPSVTYTFANSTTADATQVNQNFTDILNGLSDGTKDLSVSQVTAAGKFTASAAFVTSSTSTVVATNGGSSTVDATTAVVILAPSGTIAAYTLNLPAAPAEGQRLAVVSNGNEITALTLAANTGHTLATGAGVTQLRAGQAIDLVFRSTVWYRLASGVPRPMTMTILTSGTGTYSTPSGCAYLKVRMVAGGGGGGGGGVSPGDGGAGGQTTFGTQLNCGGGSGGVVSGVGAGGSVSLGTVTTGFAVVGGTGNSGAVFIAGTPPVNCAGGSGGNTPFGGGGAGSANLNPATAGATNTGGGGGGAGGSQTVNAKAGSGGGGGGYIEALLYSPASTYAYEVGAGGSAGSAGTGGGAIAGSDGGSGIIIIEEYYY